jgi:hypothetical protein
MSLSYGRICIYWNVDAPEVVLGYSKVEVPEVKL